MIYSVDTKEISTKACARSYDHFKYLFWRSKGLFNISEVNNYKQANITQGNLLYKKDIPKIFATEIKNCH